MEFFSVTKISGGFSVVDHSGSLIIGYRSRALAETYATSVTKGLFTEAEERNLRLDRARAYLVLRAERSPMTANQMELF
jgi:hypothetical protein